MTDYQNAERLRSLHLSQKPRRTIRNLCTARRNWNGCDYADVYAGAGLLCWKQSGKHNCIRCIEVRVTENDT